jgi:hypothetical protein
MCCCQIIHWSITATPNLPTSIVGLKEVKFSSSHLVPSTKAQKLVTVFRSPELLIHFFAERSTELFCFLQLFQVHFGIASMPVERRVMLFEITLPTQLRMCRSFQLVVCLTTGPKLLPKRALHIVRSR